MLKQAKQLIYIAKTSSLAAFICVFSKTRLVMASGLFLIPLSAQVNALTVQVIDQQGQPIENVVISYEQTMDTGKAPSTIAVMDQVDIQFSPQVLVIEKNQQVQFPNSDNTRHHIYSFSKAKPFEIKMYRGGESKQLTFEQAGIVVLGCNIHDQMVGYIYVAENANSVMTNAQGMAEVPHGQAIKLWHPKLSADHSSRQDVQLPSQSSASPLVISLSLIQDVQAPKKTTFKSKKFNRGNK